MGSMANFQKQILAKGTNGFRTGLGGPRKPWNPWAPGTMGPWNLWGLGPRPFEIGGRSQQKHFLDKDDVFHVEQHIL